MSLSSGNFGHIPVQTGSIPKPPSTAGGGYREPALRTLMKHMSGGPTIPVEVMDCTTPYLVLNNLKQFLKNPEALSRHNSPVTDEERTIARKESEFSHYWHEVQKWDPLNMYFRANRGPSKTDIDPIRLYNRICSVAFDTFGKFPCQMAEELDDPEGVASVLHPYSNFWVEMFDLLGYVIGRGVFEITTHADQWTYILCCFLLIANDVPEYKDRLFIHKGKKLIFL